MNQSISRRLLVLLLGPLSALIVAVGLVSYLTVRRNLVDSLDRRLESAADAIASLTEIEVTGIEFELDEHEIQDPKVKAFAREYFQVWLPDGATAFRSERLAGADLPRSGAPAPESVYFNAQLADGRAIRALEYDFLPAIERDEDEEPVDAANLPTLRLVVAVETADMLGALAAVRFTLAGAFGALLAFGAAILILGSKRGLAPLRSIAREVGAMDARDLGRRFSTVDVPREIKPLCGKLNELLARLQGAFEREKRFTADAAHELRTPVAELRALAQVALADAATPAEARAALEDALEISHQLESIIEGLLTLARGEEDGAPMPAETIDLAEDLRLIWERRRPRAEARGVSAELNLPRSLACSANRQAAEAILRNVLGNAAEHAPRGGVVEISARAQADRFEVRVANPAPGLEPADAERLFERFWRKDAARTSSAHAGLGLSLARALSLRLGWTLEAELTSGGKLVLILSGPCAGASAAAPAPILAPA